MPPANAPTTYSGFVSLVIDIINVLITTIFAFLFVYLIWKIIDTWILNAGDQAKREAGKKYALSAVIVVVLMMSAWGIIAMIKQSLFG
tara:strand:- start:239 stop:502 length:264 start_codon:yes stop_codon:yes gene_type:complete